MTEDSIIGTSSFSQEDLEKEWGRFIQIRKEQNAGESELMMLRQAFTVDHDMVTLPLTNSVQQDIFDKVQTDLHMHLRKTLDNRNIKIKTLLSVEEEKEMLYTNKEKFEYMVTINPHLRELQERLGLDPDI